jgi:hypothetical protein
MPSTSCAQDIIPQHPLPPRANAADDLAPPPPTNPPPLDTTPIHLSPSRHQAPTIITGTSLADSQHPMSSHQLPMMLPLLCSEQVPWRQGSVTTRSGVLFKEVLLCNFHTTAATVFLGVSSPNPGIVSPNLHELRQVGGDHEGKPQSSTALEGYRPGHRG